MRLFIRNEDRLKSQQQPRRLLPRSLLLFSRCHHRRPCCGLRPFCRQSLLAYQTLAPSAKGAVAAMCIAIFFAKALSLSVSPVDSSATNTPILPMLLANFGHKVCQECCDGFSVDLCLAKRLSVIHAQGRRCNFRNSALEAFVTRHKVSFRVNFD